MLLGDFRCLSADTASHAPGCKNILEKVSRGVLRLIGRPVSVQLEIRTITSVGREVQ